MFRELNYENTKVSSMKTFLLAIIALSFLSRAQAGETSTSDEFASGNFSINTYGNTCDKPAPQTLCILKLAKKALGATKLAATTSRIAENDLNTLTINFVVVVDNENLSNFYTLHLKTVDQGGWTERFENVPDNKCVINGGPVQQVYHTSKTLAKNAEIYTYEFRQTPSKFADLDITSCL